jgi:hypothetical protein
METTHGGRSAVKARIEAFDRKYPRFAQTTLGKQDQRDMLPSERDDGQKDVNV